jgi:hypothetical protein
MTLSLAPQMTQREYKWIQWKAIRSAKGFLHQYEETADTYIIWGYDGPEAHLCILYRGLVPQHVMDAGYTQEQNDLDLADFESVYKAIGNSSIDQRISGVPLGRAAVTKTGWHFQLHSVEITTAKWNGYYNKKINPVTLELTELGYVTYKLYDADRVEITDEANIATAVFTVVDWCVDHEMEIVGVIFTQVAPPTTDVRMWTSAAPGIANVPFGQGGLNLKNIGVGGVVDADGLAAKYMHPTIPMPGINKFRTMLKHDAGVQHTFQLLYKLFKP